jgi:hypothetical protein
MSTRLQLFHQWERHLQALLPSIRVTRLRVLALLSLGMLWSGSVTLRKIAVDLPLTARDPSRERRFRRWLANHQVAIRHLWPPLLRAFLAPWANRELLCVFDPTPIGPKVTLLLLGAVVHKRMLPLAWHPMPSQTRWPVRQATILHRLCHQINAALPGGARVTLVADAGLTGPVLIDECQTQGWHFVLRLNATAAGSPILRQPDGTTQSAWSLVTTPGQRWAGTVDCFQAAGWRTVHLTIHWAADADEPWLLISDLPAGPERVHEYRRRSRCEATFQDTKGRGWDVERTKLSDRGRLSRLLLALFLALWWAETLGLRLIRRGLRTRYDRTDRRDLSLVRLGRRWFKDRLDHGRLPPTPLRAVHGTWRWAWSL